MTSEKEGGRSEMRWEQFAIGGVHTKKTMAAVLLSFGGDVMWAINHQLPPPSLSPKTLALVPSFLSLCIHYCHYHLLPSWCRWPFTLKIRISCECGLRSIWVVDKVSANSTGSFLRFKAWEWAHDRWLTLSVWFKWFNRHGYLRMLRSVGCSPLNSPLSERNLMNHHQLKIWMWASQLFEPLAGGGRREKGEYLGGIVLSSVVLLGDNPSTDLPHHASSGQILRYKWT